MYDTNVASSLTFHDPELELASVGVLIFPTRDEGQSFSNVNHYIISLESMKY
jgi:hypothetical protein